MKNTETYKQFMAEIPHFIFKSVALATNELCGLSKTNAMISTLFATLPIKVELRHITGQPKPSSKLNALDEFCHAYIKHDDMGCVYIAFWYDSEKHIKKINKAIHKHPEFFAYLYIKEALKLTRRMNTKTHYTMMSNIIKHYKPEILAVNHYKYSIYACDFVINATIKQLFINSRLASKFNTIIEGQAYNKDYDNMTEIDVLIKLITGETELDLNLLDNEWFWDSSFGYIPATINGALPIDEVIITDLGEFVESQLINMSRGTGSASIFKQFFSAKKVDTTWFKKMTAVFNHEVHRITDTFRSEWSNLNIVYKHKFKSPTAKYEDNKLAVVLSIDHSGSVNTEGLQKLLYLFKEQSTKITKLYVLIHDIEIVKEFILDSDYDISTNPNFIEALSYRYAMGGTSHLAVFARIDELLKTKQIDKNKTIYIAFSDNYSDIPKSIKMYPSIKQLSVTFLTPAPNPMNIAGCVDISMS